MTVVVVVSVVMLAVAAVLAMLRMALGPTVLDRIVSLDVIAAVTIGGLAAEAVLNRHPDTIPILVVLSLVGFIGSTSVARFGMGAGPEREGDT
ncbi:monovalent cation/H+ antiporter complex subunit F [Streptomyces megasporus]|uniref:monovalent cation/H+ antiporter complex subunit F n=1 Tax=Streptomyces megasporus TaxID=44060 RepID=UPI0004E19B7C|nr:monovalent cation/H+ antiporter complex subunit F [Streptomyces megasporus]